MRIGVIGGTFDPIHLGHLIVAEEARVRLGLSRVVFVPAGQPPHKLERAIADPEHRFEMIRLATADNQAFCVSRVDLDREGPCYTVETIGLLQEAWGQEVEIYFLIGADSLADLPTWREPERLLRLCRLVAVARPGYKVDLRALERKLAGVTCLVEMLDVPTLDISSTEIRRRAREGLSMRYLVPGTVARYVAEHGLYRDTTGRPGGHTG
jgi:nicotinate-nucleotide adenylyltransferase